MDDEDDDDEEEEDEAAEWVEEGTTESERADE